MCLVAIIETTPGQEISLAGFRAVADASAGPPKRVRTVLLEKMIKGESWGFAIAFPPPLPARSYITERSHTEMAAVHW